MCTSAAETAIHHGEIDMNDGIERIGERVVRYVVVNYHRDKETITLGKAPHATYKAAEAAALKHMNHVNGKHVGWCAIEEVIINNKPPIMLRYGDVK